MLPLAPAGYLDATAGEPLHPRSREVLLAAYDQGWAEPFGQTPPSRQARTLFDAALDQLAELLGTHRDRISVVDDALAHQLQRLNPASRLLHSAVERAPVLEHAMTRTAQAQHVDSFGRIDLDGLTQVVGSGDEVIVQAANGEVGTIQPLEQVIEIATKVGARVHSDYTQSIGRVPLFPSLSSASVNASSWRGPRGMGIVISDQQQHSANVSVALTLAAAAALEGWLADEKTEADRLRGLLTQLRTALSVIPDIDLPGDSSSSLPHVLTASFLYVDGQRVMDELAREGLFIGSGSACSSSRLEPSHVLAAMGALTHGNVRVLLPHHVAEADVRRLGELLPGIVQRVRDDLR